MDSLLLFAVIAEGGPSIWAQSFGDSTRPDALERENLFSCAVGYYTDRYRSALSDEQRKWRILGRDIEFTKGRSPTSIRLDPDGFAELEQLHLASPLWMILNSLPFVVATLTAIIHDYNRCRPQTAETSTFVARKVTTAASNMLREYLAPKSANAAVPAAAERVIADAAHALRQVKSIQELDPNELAAHSRGDGCGRELPSPQPSGHR